MQLITKEIAGELRAADQAWLQQQEGKWSKESTRSPDKVIAKFFTPWANATWWVVQGTPLNDEGEPDYLTDTPADWHLYGFCDLGDRQCAELGYTLLSQLEEIKGPYGLAIERDLYYDGAKLSEVTAGYAHV